MYNFFCMYTNVLFSIVNKYLYDSPSYEEA
jgi:hypothetical protein